MKKNAILLVASFVLSLASFSQNNFNLVVFSEDGDTFLAYINGVRQNDTPQPNVKISGLTNPNISLRIEFSDKTLPQLKQNMTLETGFEHTAKIQRDMKKQLKLRYFGQTPLNTTSSSELNGETYHSSEAPAYNTAPQGSGNDNTTVTNTTMSSQTVNGNIPSVNINMGSVGISMNVSGLDPNASGTMNTVTSTTVTNSSYSSGSSATDYNSSGSSAGNTKAVSNTGCSSTMSSVDFDAMKKSVGAKPFSDAKMSTAKLATKNSCLSVNQVKEICRLFNMDEEKLAYAKYAYDHCVNKANFYQVSEIFSFSSTVDELNKYLEER